MSCKKLMLIKTFKVYNSDTLKSVSITGYHLVKELCKFGLSSAEIGFTIRCLESTGHHYTSPLTIDLVRN